MPLLTTQGLGATPGSLSFTINTVIPAAHYLDLVFTGSVGPLILSAANVDNWVFMNITGTVPLAATGFLISGSTLRVYTTEPRDGDTYRLTLPENGLRSTGEVVYNGDDTVTFLAVAESPVASLCASVDARTVRVTFSEPVISEDALEATNYSIDPPLTVYSVSAESDSVYLLTTDPQENAVEYTLTIINVRDLSENPV